MKDNIIDFKNHRRSKKQDKPILQEGPQRVIEALCDYFATLPQNGILAEAEELVAELTGRALLYTGIATKASETISNAGLNPDHFELDEDSFGRFLQLEIQDGDIGEDALEDRENLWNGPWFDAEDGDMDYRVATTVIINTKGIVAVGMDLLRKNRWDDDYWQIFDEGKWHKGPPEDVFDFLVAQREDMLDDDEWDEDDDEWEKSIESMLLSPGTITALHEAGILTIDELKEMTDKELLRIKGIGKGRVAEIRDALEYED